ncbi:MAG: sulfotransferase family 2 domain-containing protein [Lentibacter algarum]|uniref:sulfotransferase family 2 domain-containing protein n=1 Tax=Lentibacter algarum TaxID=576131 RepID=UPI003B8C93CE
MLISLQKNFLFIHVPKTAGSSLHHILEPYSQQNNRTLVRRLMNHLPLRQDISKAYFRQHAKCDLLQRQIAPKVFNSLHKFAAVRNPYDHMVSYYKFIQQNRQGSWYKKAQNWSFSDAVSYFEKRNNIQPVNQTSWLVDRNGEFIVDRILFFESISEDFHKLADFLELEGSHKMPHHNVTIRSDYRDYYNNDLKLRVEALYKSDFDNFGYQFDSPSPTTSPLKQV